MISGGKEINEFTQTRLTLEAKFWGDPLNIKINNLITLVVGMAEEVAWRCSAKNVFLEISQNSQENTSARVFFDTVEGLFLQNF